MNDQDFSKIFLAHKSEFPDEGFSEHIAKRLPKRRAILPQIIMITFISSGLILMSVLQVFTSVLEQINSFVDSICQMEIPSAIATITYLGILALIGLIGYSVARAEAG